MESYKLAELRAEYLRNVRKLSEHEIQIEKDRIRRAFDAILEEFA